MTEPLRNCLGFAITPALLVAAVITAFHLFNGHRPALRNILVGSICAAVVGAFLFAVCLVLEIPYGYSFTVPLVKRAKSPNGVLVARIIDLKRYAFRISSYSADWCGDYDNLTVVGLRDRGASTGDFFVYDNRQCELAPLSQTGAERFPGLMPSGDRLVSITHFKRRGIADPNFGNGQLFVPEKWFGHAIRDQH
jgi:hypothetical protein